MNSITIDLESELIPTLKEHLHKELDIRYSKSTINKGQRQLNTAPIWVELGGDEAHSRVTEKGKTYEVTMTLPLFDMGDYCSIRCSCQEDRFMLEENRCHHMWLTQQQLYDKVTSLDADESNQPDKIFANFEAFIEKADHSDKDSFQEEAPVRISWRIGPELSPTPYLQKKSVIKEKTKWSRGRPMPWNELLDSPQFWVHHTTQLAAARIERATGFATKDHKVNFFGLLQDLAGHDLVFDDDGEQQVKVVEANLGLKAEVDDKTIKALPQMNGFYSENIKVFAEQGIALYRMDPPTVFIHGCDKQTTDFVLSLLKQKEGIPLEHKEQLLEYLTKLEQKIEVEVPEAMAPASTNEPCNKIWLRLTPLEPRGLKVEMFRRPNPKGPLYPPGEGAESILDTRVTGKPVRMIRDLRGEQLECRSLTLSLGLDRYQSYQENMWYLRDDTQGLDLVSALNSYQNQEQLVVEWPKKKKKIEVVEPTDDINLKLEVKQDNDWFALDGSLEIDGQSVALKELIEAIRNKVRYIQIKPGKFAVISDSLKKRMQTVMAGITDHRNQLELSVAAIPIMEELREDANVEWNNTNQWEKLTQQFHLAQNINTELPAGFNGELRSYQKQGYDWLCRLCHWGLGACLADDMGLGKTIQTLALLLRQAHRGPSLVIAPTSVVPNWIKEAQKFARDLNLINYRDQRSACLDSLKSKDVLIMSYGLAFRDQKALTQLDWNVLVLDEAQAIKNAQTKTAKAIRSLNFNWALALSGTPVENNPGELWSLFHTINPIILGSWEKFRHRFGIPIQRWGSEQAAVELQRLVQPFILRRMKKDYLPELPAKTEMVMSVEPNEDQKLFYQAVRQEALESLEEQENKNQEDEETAKDKKTEAQERVKILGALTRLRLAACHPQLIDDEWQGDSAKMQRFIELSQNLVAGGHKALIFSQFTSHLSLLREALKNLNLDCLYLDGSTPQDKRMAMVNQFQEGGTPFFLISLKAGGTGLTLTEADYVLHLDPWWNPAVEDQATDRAWRMGQKKPVMVYRIVTEGTIEEKILQLHDSKRDMVNQLLAGTNKAGQVSTKELMDLIRG